jgi:uncharacterized integral membrane protein
VKWVKTLCWTVVLIYGVFFSIQNQDPVSLRFGLYPLLYSYHWEVPGIPLFLIILCSIFLGILIGGISDYYRLFQLKRTLRQNHKTIERLEKEIQSLRNSSLDQTPSLNKG